MTGLAGSGATSLLHPELVAAARALTGSADDGCLVRWGGQVAHGLRFTGGHAAPSPSLAASQPASAAEAPSTPPSAADHRTTGLEQIAGPDAGWLSEATGRLLLLAPATIGRSLGHGDQACRFQFCGPTAEGSTWVSVALGGWVGAVPEADTDRLAAHFARRHPTTDLFDLGDRWALLQVEVVEGFVRTERAGAHLDGDDARALLAR
ncbi:hypothetical protein [Pseudofrankia inefficax]|uniref:Pyridoxamine 5'-phosphate oxidase-related FMN-binding protein n=1 Tax=Pseudofrankia inefficax (strain DSM 45817 / CECT 9037 / DDB 130130 / EuI1c) TaxID=298654 RepID=E3JD63_PSEI1|nr:hypothetical protein [Pseudofrankia inefficax]ADP82347.1 hypothetical protein FraEuI1c_4348 [Pseudofrankia inefficax]